MKQKTPKTILKEYKEAYNALLDQGLEISAFVLFWPFFYLFIETDITVFKAFLYYFLSSVFSAFFIMKIIEYFVLKNALKSVSGLNKRL